MRIIYIILFLADAITLVFFFFGFLKALDSGGGLIHCLGVLAGVLFTILLLIFILRAYLKLPPEQ
ncbi:hypothetical protein ACLOAU_00865 [Niabella sp. CJ426]|uniref:hypothetical protein n=1 Tax=Niabella sp. CJ426 TaxID=3393740 RepID=UPI003CFD6A89